jgi:hypothetical protein
MASNSEARKRKEETKKGLDATADNRILSAEEVRSERYRYPDSTTEDGANDVIALGDSHEALRAERDSWADDAAILGEKLQEAQREVFRLREALEVISLHCENANWRQHARSALAPPVPQEDR